MGVLKTIEDLRTIGTNTRMVNMVSYCDITDYNHKSVIKYPYINIDVVNATVNDYAKSYVFRIYVCDRNKPYVAYNKCEVILDAFLKNNDLDITNYVVNYFKYDFQDDVHGVWCDIILQKELETECDSYYLEDRENDFILQENGDLIKIEIIPAK